jgi:hypothetical protein
MRLLLLSAFLLACTPLAAQGLEVGADAAEFKPNYWLNPPVFRSFEDLRGDVVLIKAWGKN